MRPIWISNENIHVFALWLQAKTQFFNNCPFDGYIGIARKYKSIFDLLVLNDQGISGYQNSDIEWAYDLFVQELCQEIGNK